MRIKSLTIQSFRGFQQARTFNFDADCILLAGPNGRGKTSVFDAILWALIGDIPRLKGTRDAVGDKNIIKNALSPSPPRVELVMTRDTGDTITVKREGNSVEVRSDNKGLLRGDSAGACLRDWISRSGGLDADGLASYLPRTHLLQQDAMMEFVREDSPRARFKLLSSFLGLGQITEQYQALDHAAKAAEADVTRRNGEFRTALDALSSLKHAVSEERGWVGDGTLASDDYIEKELDAVITSHLADVAGVLTQVNAPATSIDTVINQVLSLVQREILRAEQRISSLKRLLNVLPALSQEEAKHAQLQSKKDGLQRDYETAVATRRIGQEALKPLQKALDVTNERLATENQLQKQFVEFLQHGKRFVKGDACPYCTQDIEQSVLLDRVERLLQEVPSLVRELSSRRVEEETSLNEAQSQVKQLVTAEARVRQELDQLMKDLEYSPETVRARNAIISLELAADASEVELDLAIRDRLATALAQLTKMQVASDKLTELMGKAKVLKASVRVRVLEKKVAIQAEKTVEMQHEIEAASLLHSNLKEAVSAVKQAESDLVEQLMRGYEPVLKEFYYRIQPHPQFNDFRVDFKNYGDTGEVYFKVVNPKGEEINPSVTFSAGQASALAVSLFLALNVRQGWTDLQTVMIDDPIQYLDDISMLGLIDLLRSWADTKQLILSVHDKNLVPLLARKFRGTHKGTLVRTYYFEGLSDQGPVVSAPQDDVLDQDDVTILQPEK